MSGQDWSRLFSLLDELLELDPIARQAALDGLRAKEATLAEELERLLAMERANPDFLDGNAVEEALKQPAGGRRIGAYRLLREIGEGGMGQVWLAERADGFYQRRVALKLLRPGFASADLQQRFAREQQILARLAHAHIARLLDAGIGEDGQPYLALEYIEGSPITEYARRLKLSVVERVALILQVCAAVSHAHASLVVHRDLKPSNILVTPAGDVRLLDFGIAKLLDTGSPTGEITHAEARAFTLHYAAPEQLRGEPVGTMTDVYALGTVLYELLTGMKPYRPADGSDRAWEAAILESDAIRPSQAVLKPSAAGVVGSGAPSKPDRRLSRQLSGDLDNIILKALNKLPARRYASIEALEQDLRRYLDGRPVSARPAGFGYRLSKYLRRRGLALAGALVVVLLLGGSLTMARWQARQAVGEAARAQAMQDFVVSLFEVDSLSDDAGIDLRGLLDAGVRRAERELATEPRSQAAMLVLIARLRNNLGDFQDALRVLDLADSALERDNADTGIARLQASAQYGRAMRGLGDSGECARRLLPRLPDAEAMARTAPGVVAEFQSQLGRCQHLLGDLSAATALFESALALWVRLGDPLGEADSLRDLAEVHADAGRLEPAMVELRRAFERLGENASDQALAVSLWHGLAALHRERGELPAAESAASEALAMALRVHGSGHPVTAQCKQRMSVILVDQGRLDEADELAEAARATVLARLGENHPDLGGILSVLATVAYERGDLGRAEALIRRANLIWEQASTRAHLPSGRIDLGRILLAAGRPAEAEAAFRSALGLRLDQYGAEHPLVGVALRFLGEAQLVRGDLSGARDSLERAVALATVRHGPTHPYSAAAELALARLHWRLGEARRAEALAGGIVERFTGPDSGSRRLRWWATALRAEADCHDEAGASTLSRLRELLAELSAALPLSSLGRDIQAIERACARRVAGETGAGSGAVPVAASVRKGLRDESRR